VRILSNAAIPRGEWVHVAAVYDGSKVSLFVNKSKQSDVKAITGRVRRVSGPLFLGGNGLNATLEETRISSIARTSFGGTGGTTITYQTVRNFYYSGWRILEERERKGIVGQALGVERVSRQFVDGAGIDEHLTQDVYAADGTSIAQTYWYHANARNDTAAMTDQAGNVVLRLAYSAYGQAYKINATGGLVALSAEETELVKYGFQGREMDVETGFLNFRNRIYNPEQGRFLQRDPIGFVGGMGLYEFTGGSPHNRSDSLGLDWATDQLCFGQHLQSTRQAFQYLPRMIGRTPVNKTVEALAILNDVGTLAEWLGQWLARGWAGAAVEPTPAGEVVMSVVTGGAALWLGYEFLKDIFSSSDAVPIPRDDSIPEKKIKLTFYHYSTYPPSSFAQGLWADSSATTDPTLTQSQASDILGIPYPTYVYTVIIDPTVTPVSPPSRVDPSTRYSGGGIQVFFKLGTPPGSVSMFPRLVPK
jgi:RHS repeat-associated protein